MGYSRGFPANWSQEASNNLTKIARSTVRTAMNHPGEAFNPFSGMRAEVSYNDSAEDFEIDNHPSHSFGTLRMRGIEDTTETLATAWSEEIYRGLADDPYDIVQNEILGPLGSMS